MNKQGIRSEIRTRRAALNAGWVSDASAAAQQRVLALTAYAQARTVGCYVALDHEVATTEILRDCWTAGREVCVPACRPGKGGYTWARLRPETATQPGPLAVPEPVRPDWVEPGHCDLVVVPGLAFDDRGGRVGHGGGHFDRLLAGETRGAQQAGRERGTWVGLAFEFQRVARVPVEETDVCMDVIVTEKNTIRATTRGTPEGRGR